MQVQQGKHARQKHISKKTIVVALALLLLCFTGVTGTIAYLVDRTDSLTNTFTPAEVSCDVHETFTSNTKSEVHVKNTGNTNAYIRVAVVVNWIDERGFYLAKQPIYGKDYEIVMNIQPAGWIYYPDGYLYYANPVEAGGFTPNVIERCTPIVGRTPEGYELSVEVIASAIQSDPKEAVKEAWGVRLNESGNILEPKQGVTTNDTTPEAYRFN